MEVEVSAKAFSNLNRSLGLSPYTEESPTILGLPLDYVIENGIFVDVDGTKIRIPKPLHQIIMKYNLWLFRSEGKIEGQKDAEDIVKLIRFYYKNADEFLSKEKDNIKTDCKARNSDVFARDIHKIFFER